MKIGFISMPLVGHLNPMIALARKFRSRGQIVFIGVPDAGHYVRAAGLPFVPYRNEEFPEGSEQRGRPDSPAPNIISIMLNDSRRAMGRLLPACGASFASFPYE